MTHPHTPTHPPVPLDKADLASRAANDKHVHLDATVAQIEPRTTSEQRPWAILHLDWADTTVRALAFPTVWSATPRVRPGAAVHITGTIAFRDNQPVIWAHTLTTT